MDIIFKNIPTYMQAEALNIANAFNTQFKDRVGIRNGVVYRKTTKALYTYRTKAGNIVVRLTQ